MLTQQSLKAFRQFLDQERCSMIDFHVVLGSGFGEALKELPGGWEKKGVLPFTDVPGLKASTVSDHKGAFQLVRNQSLNRFVLVQLGRLHGYEGHSAQEAIGPVLLSCYLGVKNYILTNAAGGLMPHLQKPGGVMIIRDHVNLTGQNPLVGENPKHPDGYDLGPRFPDMGNCYHFEWGNILKKEFEALNMNVTEGVYLGILGPSFETHAEVRLFASWGMGAVGMSTVWEVIALKHAGCRVVALSLISNLAAGLGNGGALDHEQIVHTSRQSASKIVEGIFKAIPRLTV
ncbi:MAG: purine-nucleoside phosphorylase [Bdellovibrionaceae bacterium]|nr:purine-nucleoside phosphorylase [Pseudobdellovibrionaceae bacterium]MDW8189839.1 purine-nucleoside phosphorylase [Pseudobdellovibrionaceae bacterium]